MKRVIFVATNEELSNPVYLLRLWLAARNMPFSRRQWPNVICNGIYEFDGVIVVGPYGLYWPIPDIDQVLGDPRWLSYWFEESNGKPLRDVRMIERLRVIDLWFRICRPAIWSSFGR